MSFLTSSKLSLACAAINVVMSLMSMWSGNWPWAAVCMILAIFCYNNYLNAEEQ
jgi:hypothetical protein